MSKRNIIIATALVLAVVIAVWAVSLTMRSPKPRRVEVPVDANLGWEKNFGAVTSNMGDAERFVKRYPRSPGTVQVLNALGSMYMSNRKYEESIATYETAKKLIAEKVPQVGYQISSGILDINIAYTCSQSGDIARAEAILQDLMSRPLPTTLDKDTYIPQLLVAPDHLAKLRMKQRRFGQADKILKAMADKSIELSKAHPKEDWIPTYASSAYMQRINMLLEQEPPQIEGARKLAEEFKTRLPNYAGTLDCAEMIRGIDMIAAQAKGG